MEALQEKNLCACRPMESGLDGLVGGLFPVQSVCPSAGWLQHVQLGFAEMVQLRAVLINKRVD